ncbi:hypothetical protein KDL44_11205 [bacterium]|nr:hypothetical protein [bacterium]
MRELCNPENTGNMLAVIVVTSLLSMTLLMACDRDEQNQASADQSSSTSEVSAADVDTSAEDPEEDVEEAAAPFNRADVPDVRSAWDELSDSERQALTERGRSLDWWREKYAEGDEGELRIRLESAAYGTHPFEERPPLQMQGSGPEWQVLLRGTEINNWGLDGWMMLADTDGDGEREILFQPTYFGQSQQTGSLWIMGFDGSRREVSEFRSRELLDLFDRSGDGIVDVMVLDWKAINAAGNTGPFELGFMSLDGKVLETIPGLPAHRPQQAVDLDGDGVDELACWDWSGSGSRLRVFRAGGGLLLEQDFEDLSPVSCAADLDGNGRQSIVTAFRQADHSIAISLAEGGQQLLVEELPRTTGLKVPGCSLDLDRDGIADLLCGTQVLLSTGERLQLQTPAGWAGLNIVNIRNQEVLQAMHDEQPVLAAIVRRTEDELRQHYLMIWDGQGQVSAVLDFGVDLESVNVDNSGTRLVLQTAEELLVSGAGE